MSLNKKYQVEEQQNEVYRAVTLRIYAMDVVSFFSKNCSLNIILDTIQAK